MNNSFLQKVWDFIGIPFRMIILPDEWSRKFGFTCLEDERLSRVLPLIDGKLLDIGAGNNALVRRYAGEGIGVDVHDFGGGTTIVEDTRNLPFEDNSFDTITLIACINHIPYRSDVLREAYRLLKPSGKIILTMIGPFIGEIGHFLWWYSEDKHREVAEGELMGMSNRHIISLLEETNFRNIKHERFTYFLNNLFIAQKEM